MKFRGAGAGYRRVVIKTRMAALKLGSQAAGAHLRYLVRDGVSRDGQPASLYDRAGDRRRFRFIVASEDVAALSDMRAFTRDLMGQMERDLGTRLDWVAVDHFNTATRTAMSWSEARTSSART
jgi:type IV secretory pathway VirD2 relaxase